MLNLIFPSKIKTFNCGMNLTWRYSYLVKTFKFNFNSTNMYIYFTNRFKTSIALQSKDSK